MDGEGHEVVDALARIGDALDALVTRGLRAAGPDDRSALESHAAQARAYGAPHLAGALEALLAAVRSADRAGSALLLRAHVRLRLLERLLTLRLVEADLRATGAEPGTPVVEPPGNPPPLPEGDASFLRRLAEAIEDLLQSGLSAASDATVDALKVSFEEASRRRLLRLGSTLRIASEEIARFTRSDPQFSAERLSFFLGRAWVLARGMARASDEGDAAAWSRLAATPGAVPVKSVSLVVLGVFKRHVPGAFAAFELRCRAVESAGPVAAGDALSWSFVFPLRGDGKVPPEAMLLLEQKQKFRPGELLEGKVITVEQVAISEGTPRRLMLGPKAKVSVGEVFDRCLELAHWEPAQTLAKLVGHRPDPLTLPIELQDEVLLRRWALAPFDDEGRYATAELAADLDGAEEPLAFEVRAPTGEPGRALREALEAERSKPDRRPLFGFTHFDAGRLVFEPLALLGEGAPQLVALDPSKVDKAALVRAMSFD